jgi:hypothetical protein
MACVAGWRPHVHANPPLSPRAAFDHAFDAWRAAHNF